MHLEMHSERHSEMHSEISSKSLYRFHNNINLMKFSKTDHGVVALVTKVGACDVAVCSHRMLLFGKCFQAFI